MATLTGGVVNVGGAPAANNYASASLYVGDLTPDVTEALLFEIFNAVGPVASVRVCRDAATRRSLGYAYVNFHRLEDAERALDTLNFKNIRSRPCRIMWSHRDPSLRRSGLGNIFVNHLAKSIDNKQLFDTFSVFGNILSCKVANNSKRESLGYAFVHFESDEAAANAIAKVDGKIIQGEKVSVQAFKSKKDRGGANKFKYTNIFVKNLPGEFSDEKLKELFSKHGTVTSVMVTQDKSDAKQPRAFGFVNYSAPEEATAAVEALNNYEVDGRKLYVARAQKKEEREKELRDRFEQLKVERQKKYAGVNLYIKNLSDEMDDEKLNQEFAKYGSITSAKVMRDSDGKSKGFGFVCFSSPEEATKAVTEMNGKMFDNKPLYVALAQRKEARRAQLEVQRQQKVGMPLAGPQGYIPTGPNGQPLMFQGMPPRSYGVYPGQVGQNVAMPRQFRGQPGVGVGVPGQFMPPGPRGPNIPGGAPVNYQLMPINATGRGPQGSPQQQYMQRGPQQGGVRGPNMPGGPRGPQQQGMPGGGRMPQGGPGGPNMQQRGPQGQQGQPQQNFKYQDNVRNQQGGPQQAQQAQPRPQQPSGDAQAPVNNPNEPLTIKALAAAPEEMKKQMIGERLFPLIKQQQPSLAGKITGMLLEMDNGELIHLLESNQALNEKITEALQVLDMHSTGDEDNVASE